MLWPIVYVLKKTFVYPWSLGKQRLKTMGIKSMNVKSESVSLRQSILDVSKPYR